MNLPGLPTTVIGMVVVHLTVAALIVRWRWQCSKRPPITDKLLRAPGERLRQRLRVLDERTLWLMLATTLLPLAVLATGLALLPRFSADGHGIASLVTTLSLFVVLAVAGGWILFRTFNERRDVRLALRGECAVAESLAGLTPAGYHIFHDVPTESHIADDNVHHVVIGPAGVFAIQTQTHASRKALPGRKDHEIVFDGDQLVYPWGQDTQGLVPARKKAEWLAEWLYQIVGEHLTVAPVLTFPGWWVTPSTQGGERVHNPGQIAALILQSPGNKITERQSALIVRHLDARCRDVKF